MPLSSTLPRDREWEWLLMLASYPLRELDPAGNVINSASGCVVDIEGHRVLLTVEHATGNQGRWAIELDHNPAEHRTRLHQLGAMNFLSEVEGDKAETVDIAYARVPADLNASHPVYDGLMLLRHEPRLVLQSDLTTSPTRGNRYGFSGNVRIDRLDATQHLYADVEVETGLIFELEGEDFDFYKLDHPHPGRDQYKGCSGAPILNPDGDLVGILCGSSTTGLIRALPLRRYRAAVLASIG